MLGAALVFLARRARDHRGRARSFAIQYHQAPRDTVSQEVYDGWKQFNLNCARCHGEDVQGTTIAPHLILSLKPDGPINTKELFVQTVCAGRPGQGNAVVVRAGHGAADDREDLRVREGPERRQDRPGPAGGETGGLVQSSSRKPMYSPGCVRCGVFMLARHLLTVGRPCRRPS